MTGISKTEKQTTLSGIQPSGKLHIGNYLGALRQFPELQSNYDAYFMIADEHSLTEDYEPADKPAQILDVVAWFLAAGLNPRSSKIFLQSFVPEHAELTWIFSCVTPIGELERMTQYKDKASRQTKNVNAGLFIYPILQAADILLYKPLIVPIGEDQTQHLEFTRMIARRFNRRFGETFPEPRPRYTTVPRLMSFNDPLKKMSKLWPCGCIFLEDSPMVIAEKISRAVTDTSPTPGEMSPGVKNLFLLLKEFSDAATIKHFEKAHADGSIRYSDLKTALAKDIAKNLAPFQKKYVTLIKQPKKLMAVLKSGSQKARRVAQKTLTEVKQKIGLP